MSAALLVVRAEVPDPADRAAFDHWYATDHLPWAIRVFEARRGRRCWSRTDPAVHYAFYEFANVDKARTATDPDKSAPLVADFDRVWGSRVPRRREILEIVQQMEPRLLRLPCCHWEERHARRSNLDQISALRPEIASLCSR